MVRLLVAAAVVLFSSSLFAWSEKAGKGVDGSEINLVYNCEGPMDNDAIAKSCKARGEYLAKPILFDIGLRKTFYKFETISANLTEELEEDYDMILLVNSAEVRDGSSLDFIPGQSMLVVKKKPGAKKIFTRNSRGVITGLKSGTQQLSQIIGSAHRKDIEKHSPEKNYGMPYQRKGLELVPVSTGSRNYLLSYSGIFQMNWGRSEPRKRRGWGNPMSNPLYLGYYYTDKNGNRERIAYAAVHGTPKKNWKLLGKSRDSHGCTRVHPAVMEDIRAHVEKMGAKEVFEFDWDYELPTPDQSNPVTVRKPILIMIFNGYESQGA